MSEYARFCQRLYRQNEFSIKLGLERIRVALDQEGAPDRDYPILLVGGTNGKGSVASMCHAALVSRGLRVGLFTSPHLIDPRERIRISGHPIGETDFLDLGSELLTRWSDEQSEEGRLTYFEILTLLALAHFSRNSVDVAVLEVGLGGRLDATNATDSSLSVITQVAIDHREYLGDDIDSIFTEKAHILRSGAPAVICRPTNWTVEQTVAFVRRQTGWSSSANHLEPVPMLIEGRDFGHSDGTIWVGEERAALPALSLVGEHQVRNAVCALAALSLWTKHVLNAGEPISGLAPDLSRARWPGRWQRIEIDGLEMVVDGAHNPAGAGACASLVRSSFSDPVLALTGFSKGKDIAAVLEKFSGLISDVLAVPIDNQRTMSPTIVADIVRNVGYPCREAATLDEALEVARGWHGPVIAFGSLYLVGELLFRAGHSPESLNVFE